MLQLIGDFESVEKTIGEETSPPWRGEFRGMSAVENWGGLQGSGQAPFRLPPIGEGSTHRPRFATTQKDQVLQNASKSSFDQTKPPITIETPFTHNS